MADTPGLELESLFVRIHANATQFFTQMNAVQAKVQETVNTLNTIAPAIPTVGPGIQTLNLANSISAPILAAVEQITAALTTARVEIAAFVVDMTASMQALAGAVHPMIQSLFGMSMAPLSEGLNGIAFAIAELKGTALQEVATGLRAVGASLADVVTVDVAGKMQGIKDLSNALSRIGQFARSMSAADLGKIIDAFGPISKFTSDFAALAQSLESVTPQFTKITLGLQRIGQFANGIGRLKDFDPSDMTTRLGVFAIELAELGPKINAAFENITKSFGRIGTFIRFIPKANLDALDGIKDKLAGFAKGIGSISLTDVDPVIKSLGRLGNFLRLIPKAQLGNLTPITSGLKALFTDIGSISLTEVDPVIKSLGKLGNFLRLMPKVNMDLSRVSTGIRQFVMNLSEIPVAPVDDLIKVLGRLGSFLRLMPKADMNLSRVSTGIRDFLMNLGTIPVAPVDDLIKVLGKLGNFLRLMPKVDMDLSRVSTGIRQFVMNLGLIPVAPVDDLIKALGKLGNFLRLIPKVQLGNLTPIASELNAFVAHLAVIPVSLIDQQLKALGKIGNFLRLIPKANLSQLPALSMQLNGFVMALSAIPVTALDPLMKMMGRVSNFMRLIPKASLSGLPAISAQLSAFFMALSAIPVSGADGLMKSMGKLGGFLRSLPKLNFGNLPVITSQLSAFVNVLSAIPTAGTVGLIQTLNSVSRFIRFANTANLSKLPVISSQINAFVRSLPKGSSGFNFNMSGLTGGVPAGLNRTATAANNASSSTRHLGANFHDMTRSANVATGSINALKLSLAGLAGFGVYAFAQFDDGLTRVMAHMGDFAQASRSIFEKGIFDISSRSVTNARDLASGLDLLASRGMNAAMSVKALAIAETFAVASGMDMTEATRHLVDIQFALGMASQDVNQHYANMTRLSDLFVGLSPQVGSSVKQLTESFGDRYVSAIRLANMSLEDAIALQGVYSLMQIRGSEASDRASRAIKEMTRHNTENFIMWRRLGVEIFDAAGHMRPMENILDDLSSSMSGLSEMQQVVKLQMLGFENRTIDAIMPLVIAGSKFRDLRNQLAGFGNMSEQVAEMLRGDLLAQLKMLWNNVSQIAIVVGNTLAPTIYYLTSGIRTLTKAFMEMNPAVRNVLVYGTALFFLFRPAVRLFAAVGRAVLGSLVAPFRMLTGVFVQTFSALRVFLRGLVQVISLPFTGIRFLAESVIGLGRAAFEGAKLILSPLLMVGGAVISIVELITSMGASIWKFFTNISDSIMKIATAIGVFVLQMIGALVTGLINIVQFVIGLAAASLLLPFAFAGLVVILGAVTSLLFAIGSIIGSIFSAVIAGIAALWGAVVSGIASLWASFLVSLGAITATIAGIWSTIKAGASDFFSSVGRGILQIAGFFWNIAENALIIWKWIGENWQTLVEYIGNSTVALVESMTNNFKVFFGMIQTLAPLVFELIWQVMTKHASYAFHWLESAWTMLLDDMGRAFKVFAQNLVDNIGIMAPLIGKAIINGLAEVSPLQALLKKIGLELPKFQLNVGAEIGKMKNPFDGFKFSDELKNKFGQFPKEMQDATNDVKSLVDLFSRDIGDKFANSLGGFTNPFGEFIKKSPLGDLLGKLNLSLPADASKQFEEMTKNIFKPFGGVGDEAGLYTGKQGPGFQFKQISRERTMVGGPAEELLEYQQLKNQILTNEKLERLINATVANRPRGLA